MSSRTIICPNTSRHTGSRSRAGKTAVDSESDAGGAELDPFKLSISPSPP
jgi:hypothetical protein